MTEKEEPVSGTKANGNLSTELNYISRVFKDAEAENNLSCGAEEVGF